MNSSSPHPPRLACRVARFWSAISGASSRHAARCDDCRRYFNAADALETQLKRDAHRQSRPAPDGLEQRINLALQRAALAPEPPRASQRASWLVWSLAGATATALVLAFLFLQRPSGPGAIARDQVAPSAETGDPDDTAVGIVASIPDRLWESLGPSATTLAQENPLQREADSVYTDARSALRFLALNFLPSQPPALQSDDGQPNRS